MDNITSIFTEFEKDLSELSITKSEIERLTQFAMKYKDYAEYIGKLILARAKKNARIELGPFFLIDSITKREIPEYIKQFSSYLPDIFSHAFENGNREIKNVLLKMYKSWDTYYPQEFLRSISTRVRLSEIEKLVLSQKDYDDIETFNRLRAQRLAPCNPSLYAPPPVQRPPLPPVPGTYTIGNRLFNTLPMYLPVQKQQMYYQMSPPTISPNDGPFAVIAKKFRALADKANCAAISFNNPGSLLQKNKVVMQALYEETVFQCRLCGMKNDRLQLLKCHLDRHFLANFLAINDDKSMKSYTQTRSSFQQKDVWIKGIQQEELREVKQIHLIRYKEGLSSCFACRYQFDITYSHKHNDWVFTNAYEAVVENGSGKSKELVLMHKACLNGSIIAQNEGEKKGEAMEVN